MIVLIYQRFYKNYNIQHISYKIFTSIYILYLISFCLLLCLFSCVNNLLKFNSFTLTLNFVES